MKRFLVLISVFLALCACKTQQCTVHDAQCTVIRDSVSVTYKQGETPLTPLIGEESEEISRTAKAVIQRSDPTGQSPVVQRSGPAPVVRVDTVFIERWHTQTIREPTSLPYEGKVGKGSGASKFYKNCTRGFWILLLCLLGKIGFKILRGFVFRR